MNRSGVLVIAASTVLATLLPLVAAAEGGTSSGDPAAPTTAASPGRPAARAAGPPEITTRRLPRAFLERPYSVTLTTADGRRGTWSIGAGQLPWGLGLHGNKIRGRAGVQETHRLVLRFTDRRGRTAKQQVTIEAVRGPVDRRTTWSSLAVGYQTTCGVRSDGSGWCWGDNTYAAIGDGTNRDRTVPVQVPGTSMSFSTVWATTWCRAAEGAR